MKKKSYISPEITDLAIKAGLAVDCESGSSPVSGVCQTGGIASDWCYGGAGTANYDDCWPGGDTSAAPGAG